MVSWFRRPRRRLDVPRLRSRTDDVATTKVDLADLTPDLTTFLAQAAYVQLTLFENLSRAIATAPTAEGKNAISSVASRSLDKQQALLAELARVEKAPGAAMAPFTAGIDDFQRRTAGDDWFESLTTCFVTAGFLDDFFARLAEGFSGDARDRIVAILTSPSDHERLVELLSKAIDENPRLASRLAMWGRRLIGDTMLVARHALQPSEDHLRDESRIEPVFTELIASHTRRMDSLGLTA